MLEKNLFVKAMEEIQKAFDKESSFNDALDKYDNENYHCFLPCRLLVERSFIPFILYALDLDPTSDSDTESILWFIYDTNFGRDEKLNSVLVDDKWYQISSAADFYDFISDQNAQKLNEHYNEEVEE